ncbi:ParA family protein [Blastopirellula marina]|uniref:Chromosome partitioning protein n=1 Tax=Blastopirellula marina TaxID=124 RepID=A0A2S8GGA1_9BACT|nr:ParA family protein [Blastopirellula marina]PQO43453.1 chromosome partitioning protein [Blastopirellula marina]
MPVKVTLEEVLARFREIAEGNEVSKPNASFSTYAVTNFRGGIGKSTLAFNLAWEMSRKSDTLLVDVCPQQNFTQSLLGADIEQVETTIYDALLPMVMPGTPTIEIDDLIISVAPHCTPFRKGKKTFIIPGSKELFLFPSLLYTQLSAASNIGQRAKSATKNILESIVAIIKKAQKAKKLQKVLIDTSPFFGGATHLAWVTADALVVPVRVDQHSIDALRLTLSMLRDKTMDFLRLNEQAGISRIPKVHAIAMTHCGWNRQAPNTPDRSTQAYLQYVIDIVNDYADLFTSDRPVECIHLLDDFHSAGRISGSRRIPIAQLKVGTQFTIEGHRLEVNPSITRYQKELRSLSAAL